VSSPPASLSRTQLAGCVVETLSRGGWGNPDVYLIRLDGGLAVVKDFAARRPWVRVAIGRWLTSREIRAYRALDGVSAVPRLLGRVDELAFATEYRPGEPLGRGLAGRLPADFTTRLGEAVEAMHARGVVHLDLRHRSNVLAGRDGRPVVLDFASALVLGRGTRWRRAMVRCLGTFDRRAVRKWQQRLGRPS